MHWKGVDQINKRKKENELIRQNSYERLSY